MKAPSIESDEAVYQELRTQLPLSIGYLLLPNEANLSRFPDIPYRGVDRLADRPPLLREQNDGTFVWTRDENPVSALWDEVDDAEGGSYRCFESGPLWSLQRRLHEQGAEVDLVFAGVVGLPDTMISYADRPLLVSSMLGALMVTADLHRQIEPPGPEFRSIGFDISTFRPRFHSMLLQPSLDEELPSLPDLLNGQGLFPTLDEAMAVLPIASTLERNTRALAVIDIRIAAPSADACAG